VGVEHPPRGTGAPASTEPGQRVGPGTENELIAGTEDDELIMHLERDQFVAATSRPVGRAGLGRHTVIALWALRVFAVAVSLMVVYTFIEQLH
jgi:hypothetical protein